MDHKVSKDMISSGMIPSGEKTQSDLSRTQYGSAPSPSKLMDAYKSMYEKKEEVINEHHKKDADGNTIPHEGEEINEALPLLAAPLIAKGLMAAKGAMAAGKAAKLGAAALKAGGAFKKGLMTSKAVGAAGKITTTGGKLAAGTKKVGMAQKAGSAVRSAGAAMKNNPTNTALVGTMAIPQGRGSAPQPTAAVQQTKLGRRTAGMYNDVDLFDIVKGQLLDEGLNEKEVMDVMTTLTIDEINEVINVEESLAKLALKTGAIAAGGYLAKKGLDKAKQSVDNQINKARDKNPMGGNRRPGSDKIYFGK